jgi:branched-chain amino acid aminotransferase
VVTPVGKVAGREGEFTIGSGGPGQLTKRLKDRLVSIQRGEAPDKHGWITRLD